MRLCRLRRNKARPQRVYPLLQILQQASSGVRDLSGNYSSVEVTGLNNNAPSPNRSIPPIQSNWLDNAATPISAFDESKFPINPNNPQLQNRPKRTARPTEWRRRPFRSGHHLIAMAVLRLFYELRVLGLFTSRGIDTIQQLMPPAW
jgi:hypothetical protein